MGKAFVLIGVVIIWRSILIMLWNDYKEWRKG